MSLTTLPDPRGQVDSLHRQLREKSERIAALEDELRRERLKTSSVELGAAQLRHVLLPLHNALQRIFGELEEIASVPAPSDSKQTAWDSWKQKLGGNTAKAIDALLLHGAMNRAQLRFQLHCANGTVTNIITALNKAGLINKADGKISLKEL